MFQINASVNVQQYTVDFSDIPNVIQFAQQCN